LNSATSEIDHVLALYLGGTDTFDNLQALCPNCHRQKTRDERPLAFG
jgi:5-methylcytosine-specific restriction protein A